MSGKPNKDQIKSNFYLANIQLIPVLFDIYTQTENNCTYVKDLNRKPINPNKRSFMHQIFQLYIKLVVVIIDNDKKKKKFCVQDAKRQNDEEKCSNEQNK